MSAGIKAQAGEAVGEDSAGEVAAEVVLDPGWDAAAVRLLRLGEEGLEVVLDDGVEGRFGGGDRPARGRRRVGLREDRAMADSRGPAGAEEGAQGLADRSTYPLRAAITVRASTNRSASEGLLYSAGVTRTQSPFARPERPTVKIPNSSWRVSARP